MWAAILIFSVIVFWIDGRLLRRKKWYREFWMFSALLLFAASVSVAQSLQIPLPNPLDLIVNSFGPVGNALLKPFK
jgi:hypothetical protein